MSVAPLEQELMKKYRGHVVGKRAPDFFLKDHKGDDLSLEAVLSRSSALLAFYPNDFGFFCTKQLCNYRDHFGEFKALGLQIIGISSNSVAEHREFSDRFGFPFPLLSDPGNQTAKAYECRSPFMMGGVSRAVALVNRQHVLLYRYVEPTLLTRRNAEFLLSVARELKTKGLL